MDYNYMNGYDKDDCYIHPLSKLFVVLGVLEFGLFFGILCISHLIKSPIVKMFQNHDESDDYFEEIIDIPYEDKYPLNKTLNNNKKPSENFFIIENTPDGSVIMKYDNHEEGFIYWCDRQIKFSYLETAARKYVNTCHCSQLYISREQESVEKNIEENKHHSIEEKHSDEIGNEIIDSNKEEKNDGPFAKLKSYNMKVKTNSHIKQESCKFIHKGKFNEFKILNKPVVPEKPTQKLDFKLFKSLFME
jgi:hypothetical protein